MNSKIKKKKKPRKPLTFSETVTILRRGASYVFKEEARNAYIRFYLPGSSAAWVSRNLSWKVFHRLIDESVIEPASPESAVGIYTTIL